MSIDTYYWAAVVVAAALVAVLLWCLRNWWYYYHLAERIEGEKAEMQAQLEGARWMLDNLEIIGHKTDGTRLSEAECLQRKITAVKRELEELKP